MFGKLVLIILSLGAVACLLLVQRQQRIDLAAEMSRAHSRLRDHERALWRLRADVAFATRADRIERAIASEDVEWVSIPGRLDHRLQRGETQHAAIEDVAPAPALAPPSPMPLPGRPEYGG